MSIFLVFLIFVLFAVIIYFVFGKAYRQWEELILSSGFNKQADTDKQLKEVMNSVFVSGDILEMYKREEGKDLVSWIADIDPGSSDEPVYSCLVLSTRNARFPPIILSNYHYPESKTPKILRSAFEKTTLLGNTFAKENVLKLLANISDSIGLPAFMIMGRNETDINYIPQGFWDIFMNWPPEKLDHIFFNDNYVIIIPSGLRKVGDWKLHLESKERLLKIMAKM